ncbi:MAG TPA: flavin reductase family protein [Actinomycetota bacterium]|nr:flavin reductase family protein [Actinomycetota bacterium]
MNDDTKETFEELAGHLDYPMYVVTAAADGVRAGCLVGFASQCSIDPPRFMVFVSDKNHTHRVALESPALGVHVVPDEAEDLARLFGEQTGDEIDKFERCEWEPGPHDVPLLARCGDRFVGSVLEKRSVGDHTAFLLEPLDVHAGGSSGSFFPFRKAQELDPGHEA